MKNTLFLILLLSFQASADICNFCGPGVSSGGSGSGSSGVTTIGTIDSNGSSSNGATISGSNLYMQSASTTVPGEVNNSSQSFTGLKNFTNNIIAPVCSGASAASGALQLQSTTSGTKGHVEVADGSDFLVGNGVSDYVSVFGTAVANGINVASVENAANSRGLIFSAQNSSATSAQLLIGHSRGTIASPSLLQDGDAFGGLKFVSYDGSTNIIGAGNAAVIQANAAQPWAAGANGTSLRFFTTKNGFPGTIATQEATLGNDGSFQVWDGNVIVGAPARNTTGSSLVLSGVTSGNIKINAGPTPTTYSMTLPQAQGAAGSVLTNVGDGNLAWSAQNDAVNGRLTLQSGVPVTINNAATSATIVYFTPYKGNRISLYDGTVWRTISFSEVSLSLGTVTSALPYDIFVVNTNGVPVLEKVAWSNASTRVTALTTQDGIYVKNGDATRRYLGTFYTISTTATSNFQAGTNKNGGQRFLWNYYNRVPAFSRVTDNTASWSYTTASWRVADGATSPQNCVEFVIGVSEDSVHAEISVPQSGANNTVGGGVAVGVDSATVPLGNYSTVFNAAPVVVVGQTATAAYTAIPAAGYHFFCWLEFGGDSNFQFYNAASGQSGLYINIWN